MKTVSESGEKTDSREEEEIEGGKASKDQEVKNEGEKKYVKSSTDGEEGNKECTGETELNKHEDGEGKEENKINTADQMKEKENKCDSGANDGGMEYVKTSKEKASENILKQVRFQEEEVDEKADKELEVVQVEVDNVVRKLIMVQEDTPEKQPSSGSIDEVYESFPSSQVRGEAFIKLIETKNKEAKEDKKYSVKTGEITDDEQEKKEKEITKKEDIDLIHDEEERKKKEITNKENKDKENNEEESEKNKESKSTAKADSENEEQSDKRNKESLEEDTKKIRKNDTESNKPKNYDDDDASAELVFVERYVDLLFFYFKKIIDKLHMYMILK